MKFTNSEMETICRYAAPTKEETLAAMRETVPVTNDLLTKAIMEGAVRKLERIPEPECSQFISAVKALPLAAQEGFVHQKLAAAKAQGLVIQGHDISGEERFRPETRHMVMLEVRKDCFAGFRGEQFRLYLSDESYQNAKLSEQEGEIRIKKHASVIDGKLIPDRKARQQER